MIRVRTLIAAALLSIPVLTLSAASPADHSTQCHARGLLAGAPGGLLFLDRGPWWCF